MVGGCFFGGEEPTEPDFFPFDPLATGIQPSETTSNATALWDTRFDEDQCMSGTDGNVIIDLIDGSGEQGWFGCDISGIPPSNATHTTDITYARMELYCTTSRTDNIDIYKVSDTSLGGDDGDVDSYCGTCNDAYCTSLDDKLDEFLFTWSGGGGSNTWEFIEDTSMESAVQDSLDSGDDNITFVFNHSGNTANWYSCRSTEYSTSSQRPRCVIGYNVTENPADINFVNDSNLLLWYDFRYDAKDKVENYDGTPNAPDLNTDGVMGNYYQFDGSTPDIITIPQADGGLKGTSELTVSALINISSCSVTDEYTIASCWTTSNAWMFRYDCAGNQLDFITYTGGNDIESESVSIEDDAWHHVAGTYDGSELQIYLDGSAVGTALSASGTIGSGTQNCYLGTMTGSNDPFTGGIDEVSIWSRALSSDEISFMNTEYSAGRNPIQVDRKLMEYNFSTEVSGTAVDTSGERNNGTITGGTYFKYGAGTGGGYEFDGNDEIEVDGLHFNDTYAFTITGWIKPDAGTYKTIAETDCQFRMRMDNGNNFICRMYNSACSATSNSPANLALDEWQWVGCRYNGTHISSWVNGTLQDTDSADKGEADGYLHLFVEPPTANYFDGEFSDFTVWNYALSDADMLANYNEVKHTYPAVDQTDYYFDSVNGLDSNNCSSVATACKNPDYYEYLRADGQVTSGDDIYWVYNSTWYMPLQDTTDIALVDGVSYHGTGTGDLPKFIQAYPLTSSNTSCWTSVDTNIWKQTCYNMSDWVLQGYATDDVDAFVQEATYAALNAQDEMFYNSTTDTVYMYSVGNPNSVHSGTIYLAEFVVTVDLDTWDDGIWEYTEVAYSARGGIGSGTNNDNITIQYNDVHHHGTNDCTQTGAGECVDGTGNCIGTSLNQRNTTVVYNNASHCWDACASPQSWLSAGATTMSDINYSYNILTNCLYPLEVFSSESTSTASGWYFEHNTLDPKGSVFEDERGTSYRCTRFSATPSDANTDNIFIRDNLCLNGTYYVHEYNTSALWRDKDTTWNYNWYEDDYTTFALDNGVATTWTEWKAIGYDANSYLSNAFTMLDNYVPADDQDICTAGVNGGTIGAIACTDSRGKELFVDKDSIGGSCSDAYTREQNSITQPWCSFDECLTLTQVNDGDSCSVRKGTYNSEINGFEFDSSRSWTTQYEIKPYNNEEVNFTGVIDLATLSWTSLGGNVYRASYVTTVNNFDYYIQNTTGIENVISLFSYDSSVGDTYADMADADLPWGCFYDETAQDYFECKLPDNPNTTGNYWFSRVDTLISLSGQTGAGVLFSGFNVLGTYKTIGGTTHENVEVANNTINGGYHGMDFRGDHVYIHDNTFVFNTLTTWYWQDVKSTGEETSAIFLQSENYNSTVANNTFDGYFNGVYADDGGSADFADGLVITKNSCDNILDDCFELEELGQNIEVSYNNCTNSLVCVSVIPFNSSGATSYVKYNIMDADASIPYYSNAGGAGSSISAKSIKIEGSGVLDNVVFDHNTIIDKGMIQDGQRMYNCNWTNNIFYSSGSVSSRRPAYRTGTDTDGNYWNNNSYYVADTGTSDYFCYYCSYSTSTCYDSLASAVATGRCSSWNTQSLDVDPDLDANYAPAYNNAVCTGDTEGSYMGAVPCQSAPADSCTYSSGDWNIDCSDNCLITSTDVGGNNVYINGSGYTQGLRNITNAGTIRLSGGCRGSA